MRYTVPQLVHLITEYADNYGIDPAIAIAQLRRESANFRDDVVYGPYRAAAGERGVAQFTPGTWPRWGSGPHTNAYDPDLSLQAWGEYMMYLLNLFGGDYAKALMGYNGGEGHLTNPARHGGPSQAAQRYAREVIEASKGISVPALFDGDDLPSSGDPSVTYYDDPPSSDVSGSLDRLSDSGIGAPL